ncbi:response regulator [Roseofilum capinflatum]|uniref:Response regulator n=1 Tax=Roseofilum capinflatum BLCC-M114 TaxID=3022440 RepID=A0ABT7B9G8_9CYAN|nr:response regulator [Roseofilum capinflatum]MDJ1175816.1 response regulator [Roseofilum capinflatum BLCC-M114]
MNKQVNKKVLIADDEPNILILMEQALEKLEDEDDVILLTAKNGQEALEIIEQEKPDLVFLDVMMPKMNGLEVCAQVKQNISLDHIYIIMLTAKGQEFDKKTGIAVGANLYMTKPFRPKEVLAKSREILGFLYE